MASAATKKDERQQPIQWILDAKRLHRLAKPSVLVGIFNGVGGGVGEGFGLGLPSGGGDGPAG